MAEATVELVNWPAHRQALLSAGIAFQTELVAAVTQIGEEVKAKAIALSPVGKREVPPGVRPRGGVTFRDSWVTHVEPSYEGGAAVTLGNIAPHAPYVVNPTRSHEIWAAHLLGSGPLRRNTTRPLRSVAMGLGYLCFFFGNRVVFAHHVTHPGTAGNPVHLKANEQMADRYQQIAREHAERLSEKIAAAFQG